MHNKENDVPNRKGIDPNCYTCIINQALSTAKNIDLDRTETQDLLDLAMRYIQIARFDPIRVQHIVRYIADAAQREIGNKDLDLYADIKAKSHQTALTYVDSFEQKIKNSDSPLEIGLKIAAAGNIIDFGAKSHGSFDIKKEMDQVDQLQFGCYHIENLKNKLEQAKELLYICDNVGELDFDKIFMEQIHLSFPSISIVAAMRERPIINDATVQDAIDANIDKIAHVMSSGSPYPGTILAECSPEFINHYNFADVILSKGQGNFETLLNQADERVFFILRIKCETMANLAGHKKGDLILMQGQSNK